MHTWKIQQAKQHLSEIIRTSSNEGPQLITNHGEPIAWVISDQEYIALTKQQESIVDFFQRSPHRDIDLTIERMKNGPRSIE